MSQRFGSRSARGLILCAAVTLALSAMQAHAVGLGTIEVKSRLDQPFVAEIPLTLNDPSEANELVVRLASSEAFERVGLVRANEVSANLQFSIGKNARGEPVIRVTTPQRMHDPYVSFLLEADWGKGKMVREYTALLDPPHTVSVPRRVISAPVVSTTPLAPAPVVTPPSASEPVSAAVIQSQSISAAPPPEAQSAQAPPPINAAAQPEPVPPPVAGAPPPEPQPEPAPIAAEPPPPAVSQPAPVPVAETTAPAAPVPTPEQTVPAASATPDSVTVAHGDTLSGIAGKVRSSEVSVNRMMIALQRTNPDAFIHGNINLLKSGSVLRIPGSEQTQALTAEEANALVHEQVESWRQNGQPTPQLQPEEGAETAIAKTPKRADSTPAPAVAEKPAPTTSEAPPASVPAPADASAAPKPEATAGTAHIRKPRGARLEIVPPAGNASHGTQSGASEGGSGSELRAQLAQTKEELAARNSEVGDLKSRVADLEKIQKDSQQLLTMKDSQLADLQHRLAELEKKAAAPAASASVASTPASTVAGAPATNGSVAASPAASTSTTSAPKPAAVAAANPAKPASTEPVESLTPWYMQTYVLIGGALVILAGILSLMLKRPRAGQPAPRPRNGVLAASLESARAAGANANVPSDAQPAAPSARIHNRATITDPLQPAMPPVSKPYWTGPVAAVPAAASAPPSAEVAPAVPEAVAEPHGDDAWAIDDTPEPEPVAPEVTTVRSAVPDLDDPSQTVATKLELARAYIDIGDSDGARSMLEEVLIEGSSSQQEEAFKLLDILDS